MRKKTSISTMNVKEVLDGIYQVRNKALSYLIAHSKSTAGEVGNYLGCMEGEVAYLLLPGLVDTGIVKTDIECRDGSPVKVFSVNKERLEEFKKTLEGLI